MIDHTGKRFGRLLVIKRIPRGVVYGNKAFTTYLCRCDCGKEIEVRNGDLTTGNTRSCGCFKGKNNKQLTDIGE